MIFAIFNINLLNLSGAISTIRGWRRFIGECEINSAFIYVAFRHKPQAINEEQSTGPQGSALSAPIKGF